MADKFPELDVAGAEQGADGDFLAREHELLGDEFKTDADNVLESDDEILEFKLQFPEVDGAPEPAPPVEEEFEGFSSAPAPTNSESEALKEWRERTDLEINEREKVNAKKKAELVKNAQQSIDDFYSNYNENREKHSKALLKEEEDFLAKRDGFLAKGTLWDRVNQLVDEAGEVPEDRDKSRFKGLLTKLKGKENVPGAGGHQ